MPFIDYINAAIDLVYPRLCFSCDKAIAMENEKYICEECRKEIDITDNDRCLKCGTASGPFAVYSDAGCVMCKNVTFHFDSVFAVTSYHGAIRELIHKFKYGCIETLANPLGNILIEGADNFHGVEEVDLVIPVPLFWKKQVKRGFNQSAILAKKLAKHLRLPVSSRNLIRTKNTETQTHLVQEERHENVKDAFVIKNSESIAGKNILLVDDVMTTGVTASECAYVLKNYGNVNLVHVIILARVDKH